MHVRAEGVSDIGRCRNSNEDSFSINDSLSFYVVADGVGGQPAGEIASRLVADRLPDILGRLAAGGSDDDLDLIDLAVREVNGDLLAASAEQAAWRGMSTTVVAAWYRPGNVIIANVGDSRAYLVRDQQIELLSEDHTVLAEQQREGLVAEGTTNRMAHVLTRCLGLEDDIEVTAGALPVVPGDRVLLCSDGLTDSLSDEVIRSVVLSSSGPGEACRMLVELANRNGGRDNITVLLIFFEEGTLRTKLSTIFGRRK